MFEYAINVDWGNQYEQELWEMTGRNLMLSRMLEEGTPENEELLKECKEYDCDPEEYAYEKADEHIPMMNYAYPLEIEPSEGAIIEVCTRTNCTVVEKDGDYFLALCGGGMDLSQDIALAYNIAQKWLPTSLLQNVSSQYGLSKSGEEFEQIQNIIVEQSEMEGQRLIELAKKWKQIKIPKKDLKVV